MVTVTVTDTAPDADTLTDPDVAAVADASGIEPDWAHREYVIFAPDGSDDWWARARTDLRWDLRLQLRSAKGRFDQEDLERRLRLPTWNEIEGLPRYGSRPRVAVRTRARGWDTIVIWGFYEHELSTDEFRRFVRECWESRRDAEEEGA